jgi:hemerythrin-like domain-containing protein
VAEGQALIAEPPVERDAIEVLEDEHDALQTLFARVSGVDEDRHEILKRLIQTLSVHVTLEKQFLVPVVKEHAADGTTLADHLSDYHDKTGRIMTLLDRRKVNSPDVPDLVTELLELTKGHISEANTVLFPALYEALSADDLTALGTTMLSDERQILTHPHPHLPDTGPVATVSRWAASLVDRGRDNSTDIGRSST